MSVLHGQGGGAVMRTALMLFVCVWPAFAGPNAELRTVDLSLKRLPNLEARPIWLYGAEHGSGTDSRDYHGLVDVAVKALGGFPELKTVLLLEGMSRPLSEVSPDFSRHLVRKSTHVSIDHVLGLENSLLDSFWILNPEDSPHEVTQRIRDGRHDRQDFERFRFWSLLRSYFIAEASATAARRFPENDFRQVHAMGLGHLDVVLRTRLHELGVPVGLAIPVGGALKLGGIYRKMDWIKEQTNETERRDIQEKLVASLLENAQYVSVRTMVNPNVSETKAHLNLYHRESAVEVIEKCQECLCFMDKVGVR